MRRTVIALLVLGAGPAHAHHDTAVGRVGEAAVAMASSASGLAVPRVDLGAVWSSRSFSRTLRGSDAFAGRDGASVHVHQLSPSLAVELTRGTRIQATLPMGAVQVADKPASLGLGDAQLAWTQRIASRPNGDGAGDPERSRAAWLTVTSSAPTGRYDRSTAVSLVDVQVGEDGDLRILPYDTRASLGAGAFTGGVQLSGQLRHGPLVGDGWLAGSLPLHDTPDGIRWGADLSAGMSGRRSLAADRVELGLGTLVSRHVADSLSWRDAHTDAVTELRVGARTAVRGMLLAALRSGERLRCTTQVRLPLFQHVQGTQLVETWSASAGCSVALPVGARW